MFPPTTHHHKHEEMPTTSTPYHTSRITYFITRSNGLPVPLIPADELPFTIKLQNVPRVLSPEQTYGLQYIGNAPYTGCTFKLESGGMQRSTSQPGGDHVRSTSGIVNGKPYTFLAPDALARQAAQNIPKRPLTAHETAKSWRRSDPISSSSSPNTSSSSSDEPPSQNSTQSVIDAILATASGAETASRLNYHPQPIPPSGIQPDQEKKEYCTHWILQGWCAYEQQGCRYKHEMLDKEGLSKIGIRHVPRWWQERCAPVKMGGIVGPLRRPEEWLKDGKGSEADSEGSESGSTDATSEEEEGSVGEEEKKMGKKVVKVKSPVVPPTRPPTPVDSVRKSSSGSDLIDWTPLIPTPSTSSASDSSSPKPPAAVQILKRIAKQDDAPKKVELASETPGKTTRIFVPAGESPEKHIAEVKRRERVVRTKSSPSPKVEVKSPKNEEVKPKVEVKSPKAEEVKPAAGLDASRWAKTDAKAEAADASSETKPRKLTKSGCRPRRPASSSPAAKTRGNTVTAVAEKK